MPNDHLQSDNHAAIRGLLRLGGGIALALGLLFMAVGLISFFSSFGTFESPRYFWCMFVGMPLFGIGLGMLKAGYLGAITRYMANETAPVAKDTINYIGEGTQPGVKATARAIAEGLREGSEERKPE